MNLLAQSTLPALPPAPESWGNLLTQIIALVSAITALLVAWKAIRGTAENKADVKQVAQATSVLDEANKMNNATVDVSPQLSADVRRIGTGDGGPVTPTSAAPPTLEEINEARRNK